MQIQKNIFTTFIGAINNFISDINNFTSFNKDLYKIDQALDNVHEFKNSFNNIRNAINKKKNIINEIKTQFKHSKASFNSKATVNGLKSAKIAGKVGAISDIVSFAHSLSLLADAQIIENGINDIFEKSQNNILELNKKINDISIKSSREFWNFLTKSEIISWTSKINVSKEAALSEVNSSKFLTLNLLIPGHIDNRLQNSKDSYSKKQGWIWKDQPKNGYLGADQNFYTYDHNWLKLNFGAQKKKDDGSFAKFENIELGDSNLNLFDDSSLVFKSDRQFKEGFELLNNNIKNIIKQKINEIIKKWSNVLSQALTNIVLENVTFKVNFQTKYDSNENLVVEYFDLHIKLKLNSTYIEVSI